MSASPKVQPVARGARIASSILGGVAGWGLACGVLVAMGAFTASAPKIALVAAAGLLATVVCWLAPRPLLPLGAAAVSIVVPVQVIKLAFGAVPFGIWLMRSDRRRPATATRVLAIAAGLWATAAMFVAPIHRITGYTWFAAFMIGLIVPLAYSLPRVTEPVRQAYTTFVGIIAGYGILEKWVLHSDPLYGHLLSSSAHDPVLQIWSSYRATTIIGQPLINATIFGPTLVLAVDQYLRDDRRTSWSAVRAVLLGGGLAATVSRGPIVATAVGIVLLLLLRRPGRQNLGGRRIVATVVAIGAAFVLVPTVIARSDSVEGQGSLLQRSFLVKDTELALSHSYLLGVGPGLAEPYREAENLPRSGTALESMFAQVLVELGIPGFILLFAAIGTVVLPALRRAETVGASVAALVMIASLGTFDSIESRQNLMVVLGFLLCMVGPPAPRSTPSGGRAASVRPTAQVRSASASQRAVSRSCSDS